MARTTVGRTTSGLDVAMERMELSERGPGGWRWLLGSRMEVLVLGFFAAALALGGLVWWTRGAPAQVAPPSRWEGPSSEPTPAAGAVVHVAGRVRRPGLYEMPPGCRVADAIESAGGPVRGADLDALNIAEPCVDGTQILVPGARAAAAAAAMAFHPSGPDGVLVDLNSADAASLEQIPGIGPVKAAAILAFREEHGGFDSVEQLLEVTGIGPATLERLRPHVSV